jgi:hypothetical protein
VRWDVPGVSSRAIRCRVPKVALGFRVRKDEQCQMRWDVPGVSSRVMRHRRWRAGVKASFRVG